MKHLSSRWMRGFLANIWCTSGECPGATTLPSPHWNRMNYLNKSLDKEFSGSKPPRIVPKILPKFPRSLCVLWEKLEKYVIFIC